MQLETLFQWDPQVFSLCKSRIRITRHNKNGQFWYHFYIHFTWNIHTLYEHNGLNKCTNNRLFDLKNVVKLSIVLVCEDVEVVMELCGARRVSVRPRQRRVGFPIQIVIILVIIWIFSILQLVGRHPRWRRFMPCVHGFRVGYMGRGAERQLLWVIYRLKGVVKNGEWWEERRRHIGML